MRIAMPASFLATFLLSACVHERGVTWDVRSIQVGQGATPKPPTCAVRQELLSPKQAQDSYRQVGVLCHVGGWHGDRPVTRSTGARSSTASWAGIEASPAPRFAGAMPPTEPATLIDDVREDTCRLGGEIIVRHGFCSLHLNGRRAAPSGVEFGVYAPTPPSPSPVALD